MAASGAKYGMMTSHFYWVGAIPAMVFVGIFMMPFYYGSRARSVPEYLRLRFDEKTRGFNAITFAVMTVFSSGISMYALAKLLELVLGWNFHISVVLSAVIVLVYIFLGGLTSAIYNEVLQFFLIVLGFLPLVLLGLKDVGGWSGLTAKLVPVATNAGLRGRRLVQLLAAPRLGQRQPDGRRMVRDGDGTRVRAVVRLLVHRLPGGPAGHGRRVDDRRAAHAAARRDSEDAVPRPRDPARHDRHRAAHRAAAVCCRSAPTARPTTTSPMPVMLAHYLPTGLLGLGLTALMASFMSGMAGNVTAFNTVWTYDIYQSYIRPGQTDRHYLRMGHAATVFGILAERRRGVRGDPVQQHHGHAPAGVRVRERAAVRDLPAGDVLAAGHRPRRVLRPADRHRGRGDPPRAHPAARRACPGIKGGFLGTVLHTYPSEMAQNFWTAIVAWTTCFVATIVISLLTRRNKTDEELKGLVYSLTPRQTGRAAWRGTSDPPRSGVVVLGLTLVLNIIFW